MSLRDLVKTVVLVMMENRSFDHMLGHLSYEGIIPEANGLRRPLNQDKYKNFYAGSEYKPFPMKGSTLPLDPPHEYSDVAIQMALSSVAGRFTMSGFVEAFANRLGEDPGPRPAPMGFFKASEVPITSFLAQNYCTCDAWFSPLPSSTQPNRTLAFCGSSEIFRTSVSLIPCEDIIFEWLDRADVRWRVYHDGLTFFSLYRRAWDEVLGSKFRDFEYLYRDVATEPLESSPQLILVEPTYEDAPHFGSDHANDNHAPLAIGWGEEFLRRTYQAVVGNPQRWQSTVMIIYYDEHGGFWDHESPPRISYTTKGDPARTFESLGPRIPAIIVSPLVDPGSFTHELLDHTSVLQFLAELFTPGEPYSEDVEARRQQGIASVSSAITRDTPRADTPPAPPDPILVQSMLGEAVATPPRNELEASFELAANDLLNERPAEAARKYPELLQWQAAAAEARALRG